MQTCRGATEILLAAAAQMAFHDAEFPPTNASITGESGGDVPDDLIWVRAPELLKDDGATNGGEPALFDGIDPTDILQGELGDCWLMSAFASCAEYPRFVAGEVFADAKYREDGRCARVARSRP